MSSDDEWHDIYFNGNDYQVYNSIFDDELIFLFLNRNDYRMKPLNSF